MKYLSGFWNGLTLVRNGIANFVFVIVIIVILVAIFSSDKKALPKNAPLLVSFNGVLVDELTHQLSPMDLFLENQQQAETLVRDVVNAIKHAAKDDNVSGLALDLDPMLGGSFSKLEEIGQAINLLKASGKPVVAFADQYSQGQYFLASYADTIYLNPLGNVGLTGFAYYGSYFKEAADKLSLTFHLFKVGDYKDAAEPYVRNSMSDASREHNSGWITELWERYTSTIELHRALDDGAIDDFVANIKNILENYEGDFATLSRNTGLVDTIVSRVELNQALIEKFGKDKEHDLFKYIPMSRYLQEITPRLPQPNNNIGLITASGTIVDGSAPVGQIGGDSLSHLIQLATEDESLKALIIRVDSGGGSAFASEVIRDEILYARSTGLPVYISMGSVAASGGYWIATAADEVWALPSTITGSIGVWGLIPNVAESMKRLGVHSDGFGTTPLSDIYQIDRPMSDDAKQVIQSSVESIYRKFINLVAQARDQTAEDIHNIAQGRVWTGSKAYELGLVDSLGTFEDLVAKVSEKYEIDEYRIKKIDMPLTPYEQFVRALMQETKLLGEGIRTALLGNNIAVVAERLPTLPSATAKQNGLTVYAQCVSCLAP